MEVLKVYKNVRNHDMGKTIFNWEPIPLERTVLDTAEKIEELIKESGR